MSRTRAGLRARDGCAGRVVPVLESLELRRLLATVVVTTLEDVTAIDGKTSLRETVTQAAANDLIEFHATLSGVITLNNEIELTKNVTIQGRGAGTHQIRGSGTGIFNVGAGTTAAINSLSLTNGSAISAARSRVTAR